MAFARIIIIIGITLLIIAWVSAAVIPIQARNDFTRLVHESGGSLSTPGDYMGIYQQICANRRMLQDFYIGMAGLICLGVGLLCWKEHIRPSNGANAMCGNGQKNE